MDFEFEGRDSLAQFSAWAIPVVDGGPVSVIAWNFAGVWGLVVIAVTCSLLVLGVRSSISVRPGQVQVVRRWFFVPYKTYVARCIDDVSYGGDYGLEEGAVGVVVQMGGRDVHLGTSKNMRYLHDALLEVAHRNGSGML